MQNLDEKKQEELFLRYFGSMDLTFQVAAFINTPPFVTTQALVKALLTLPVLSQKAILSRLPPEVQKVAVMAMTPTDRKMLFSILSSNDAPDLRQQEDAVAKGYEDHDLGQEPFLPFIQQVMYVFGDPKPSQKAAFSIYLHLVEWQKKVSEAIGSVPTRTHLNNLIRLFPGQTSIFSRWKSLKAMVKVENDQPQTLKSHNNDDDEEEEAEEAADVEENGEMAILKQASGEDKKESQEENKATYSFYLPVADIHVGHKHRLKFQAQMTADMEADEYARYAKARETNFLHRNVKKDFASWMGIPLSSRPLMMLYNFLVYDRIGLLIETARGLRDYRKRKANPSASSSSASSASSSAVPSSLPPAFASLGPVSGPYSTQEIDDAMALLECVPPLSLQNIQPPTRGRSKAKSKSKSKTKSKPKSQSKSKSKSKSKSEASPRKRRNSKDQGKEEKESGHENGEEVKHPRTSWSEEVVEAVESVAKKTSLEFQIERRRLHRSHGSIRSRGRRAWQVSEQLSSSQQNLGA